MIEEKVLRVVTSEFLPVVEDRRDDTIYFVYDKMELHLGKSFYSDPFCIVEELPEVPVTGMLYITIDGVVRTYIDYSWYVLGRCLTEDEVELITKAGTIYFLKAEYRYLDLQTRSIILPYQNGSYQLSVNLAKCLQIDKDTVIFYDETTGHFEIDGNRNDTELHINHGYEAIDTDSIQTIIQGNRILSNLKLSDKDGNVLKIYEGGLYANTSQFASKEELDEVSELYIAYKSVLESMITELHDEMEDKGYNTTTEMIAEKIAQALEEYEPTIHDLITNYNLIYEQLGYIRDIASKTSEEKIEEVKNEIIDYLNQIREAWANYDRDSQVTIDDIVYTKDEQEYLANAVEKAVNDIKLRRKNPDPVGTPVPFAFMFIGGTDEIVPTKQITPPRLDVRNQKSRLLGYTNIVVVEEKVNPSDEYYYALASTTPALNEDIVAAGIYKRFESPFDLICRDGQFITVVEVDSNKKAIKYNNFKAEVRTSEYTGMEVLDIQTFEGTTDYHMRLIVTPPLRAGNTYMYAAASTIPEYGEIVPYNYFEWDGTGEIDVSMFTESLVTLVECDADTYVSNKIGTFRAYSNEVLKKIDIVSTCGHDPETTTIYVAPGKADPTNDYYYSDSATSSRYDAIIPNDYRWKYWDGSSDIKTELGKTMAIVECNYAGRARKFGYLANPNVNNEYMYYTDPISVTYTGYIKNTIHDPEVRTMYYRSHTAGGTWLNYGDELPAGYTMATSPSDGTFVISFERDIPIDVVTIKDGRVYKFASKVDPVIKLVNDLDISANSADNRIYIVADTSEYPTNKWYYQLMITDDTRQYYMNEPLDPLGFVEWDKTGTIPLESSDFTMIKLVVVDSNNTIIAFGKCEIEVR